MQAIFPLWKRPTSVLAREIIALGFKGYLSCVEGKVGPGFAGRSFDNQLLSDLPADIDPCGENGEFHTFVYAGPIFSQPLDVQTGQVVVRDGRYYADLLPSYVSNTNVLTEASIPPVR
jgi:diphthamide synthase (EF-2-diphthine--ammonia ligase)